MSRPEHPEEHVSLAAEHALGVLNDADRREAEARAAADPSYRAELRAWEDRLAPMADEAPPVAPPEALWTRVRSSATVPPIDLAARRPAAAAPPRRSLWNSVGFWRAAAGGMAALAAACLALAVIGFGRPERVVVRERIAAAPPMMAAELNAGGQPLLMVAYDPVRRVALLVPMTRPAPDPQHSHELWLIPADGQPRSLGLLNMSRAGPMPMRAELVPLMGERAVLAITVEPVGGSPTGRPSAPPIASGEVAAL